MKRAIFVGRWSPFHNGHLAIMQTKIDEGVPLLILIRDTHYDLYPPRMRKRMIEAAMLKLNVDAKVMIIDDIESINYGRGVGYEVNEIEVAEDIKHISATEIRSMINSGNNEWKKMVPDGADKILSDYLLNTGTVVWLTGLPKAGKREISRIVSLSLENHGIRTESIDGAILRKSISSDLGFTKEDRNKNLDRAVYIAKILARNGAIVLCSFVTPFESQRRRIASELEKYGNLIQVYVKASIDLCKQRDADGIYKMAEEGKIEHFTGVSSPYEEPDHPDLVVDTNIKSLAECADEIVESILQTI